MMKRELDDYNVFDQHARCVVHTWSMLALAAGCSRHATDLSIFN